MVVECICVPGGCLCWLAGAMGWNWGSLGVMCKAEMISQQQTWRQVKTLTSFWMKKATEEQKKKVTFSKRFFLFPLKEWCLYLRIIFLPRSFWQHSSILPRNTWAYHFFFSPKVHSWPFQVPTLPSPSLIHKTCINCVSPCCSLVLENSKRSWYIVTDIAEVSLTDFTVFWGCAHTNTPQLEDKTNTRLSCRLCNIE